MQHRVDRAIDAQILCYVLANEAELRLVLQMSDVAQAACDQIVDNNYLIARGQKAIAKMRTQKARSPSDQDTHAGGPTPLTCPRR